MTPTTRVRASAPPKPSVGLTSSNRVRLLWFTASVGLLGVLVVASIAIGSKELTPSAVFDGLVHPSSDAGLIIYELRVPRTALAIVAGLALGVSGALVQALARNPLADPGLLGVNAGASFPVVVAVSLLGLTSISQYIWFAFAGALITSIVVYLVGTAGRRGGSALRLTLVGVGFAAILSGITTGLTLIDPRAFDEIRNWNAGSVTGRPIDVTLGVLPFVVVGFIIAIVATHELNAIALGEDLARSLGAPLVRTRLLVVVAVALLAGSATAAAGPIAFVGLMIPHVACWIVGPDQRWILALTCVLAPCLLLFSDIIGRVVLSPAELPVGIVTAFVGAPVLILLGRRSKASGL